MKSTEELERNLARWDNPRTTIEYKGICMDLKVLG